MAKIKTPVEGYTGVRAGVAFAHGVGETDDQAQINYFLRHGYTVDSGDKDEKPAPKRTRKAPAKKAAAPKPTEPETPNGGPGDAGTGDGPDA